MELNTKEVLKKKNTRCSGNGAGLWDVCKNVQDTEVADLLRSFAEESGYQARKLQDMLKIKIK